MSRRKNKIPNPYAGIEPGLRDANRNIRLDKESNHNNKILVEKIVRSITSAMKKQSPSVFGKLYVTTFGGGSSYEDLKTGPSGDYDIDILLKIPDTAKPTLHEDTIPGYAQLQLLNFHKLEKKNPDLYKAMCGKFVDEKNFLLTKELKSAFMQSIFDKTVHNYFPGGVITVEGEKYEVYRILNVCEEGPAFTLTIEGVTVDFFVKIDLVPCIVLNKNHWPKGGFRSNPYRKPGDIFLVPKQPKRRHEHLSRYFRLSFQKQERLIISNRFWMKPTIRQMKCIKKHFGQEVSSYAIKTLCMWELWHQNPSLDRQTPDIWRKSPSGCLVYMLEKYLQCLVKGEVQYFWNNKLNLLNNLSEEQINLYKKQISGMLREIKDNPKPETILKYLTF